ncbi:hypothetical protein [Microvirga sp. VF16]|uniref:hypothetical protein n=1 Tax=Microvirga sp. VF16 TaxID=2807101 RepID=UPI00193CBB81|nr:hypothetical protein [Microvirga sp. VF16]QRM33025.1 hypothetical protein JO965_27270 [Microvirga sp. VF16]
MRPPLLIRSHFGEPPKRVRELIAEGRVITRNEWEVEPGHIREASGVLTTMHLDQIRALGWRDAFEVLLNAGGRVGINGHVARPFIVGLESYVPLPHQSLADLRFDVLAPHSIFAGIDRLEWRTSKGVAGFYGRGHNPMPEGGIALTGIGPGHRPIDWVWHRSGGGVVFSHAGNDLWGMSESEGKGAKVVDNLIAWAAGELEP